MDIYKTPDFNNAADTGKSETGSWMTVAVLIAILTTFAVSDVQAQQVFVEDFSTDTLKDPATTADWDTGLTETNLKLPTTTSLSPVQSLNNSFAPTDASTSVDAIILDDTRAVAVGDLDGDGDLDLAFGNNGLNSIYFNDGFGTFSRGAKVPDDYFVGSNSRSVAIADLNGDGHLDVLVAEFGGGQATRVHFNNGSGSNQIFTAGEFADLGESLFGGDSVATGDVDNDNDIDVVLGVDNGYVKLFRNDGFGNFAAAEEIADTDPAFGFHARTVLLGDLDGDGDLDLVAAREDDSTRIYLNDGSGVFGAPQSAGVGVNNSLPAPDSVALGDVNGDGLLDLVVGNDGSGTVTGTANANYLFLNSGLATIFPAVSFSFADMANTNGAHLLDVDRDGDLDIVTASFVSGNGFSVPGVNRLYINDPVANTPNIFPATGTSITADSRISKAVASGDFDGDNNLDLVFANEDGNAVNAENRIVINAGTDSGFSANQLFATGLSVSDGAAPVLSFGVVLDVVTNPTNVEANRVFQYWLSNDGGLTWIAAHPDRSVAFPNPAGTNLVWRIEFNSPSTLLRPDLGQIRLTRDRAPTFTSTEETAAAQDVEYIYNIDTNDTDGSGDLLDISATVLPAWLTLTDNGDTTATLIGTPLNVDVAGPNDVTLEVVDGAGRLASQTFTIVVADANDAPVVPFPTIDQVFDQNVELLDMDLDTSLAFDDPDDDILTYSATGLPASLTLAADTGMVTGILTNDDVFAGPHSVVVTADDGLGGTVDDSFLITVNNVNDAPDFTSTEVTAATEVAAYSYAVVTEDIDGDAVTISDGGLPAWLTLTDNLDGTADLSGTPAGSDVGVPVNVTLTVSDGTLSNDQVFTITVIAAGEAPVISLVGAATVTLTVGDTYVEEGATAVDAQDGDLTLQILTDSSNVNTGVAGTYTVTYNVTDGAGNAATEVTRTVTVNNPAPTPPPVQRKSGGGGSTSMLGLALLAGLTCGRRRRKRLDS